MRSAETPRLRDGHDAEFGRRRAPDEDKAGVAQPAHGVAIVAGTILAEQIGAEGQALARHRVQLLDGNRHTGEGTWVAWWHGIRRGQRLLGLHQGEGVQVRMPLDLPQRRLHQLA